MNHDAVLLDTSFFIQLLNPNYDFHENAKGYFKYFLENEISLVCSTISVGEFCVVGGLEDLPLRNLQILPFNLNHAKRTGPPPFSSTTSVTCALVRTVQGISPPTPEHNLMQTQEPTWTPRMARLCKPRTSRSLTRTSWATLRGIHYTTSSCLTLPALPWIARRLAWRAPRMRCVRTCSPSKAV